jgi:uncharacterized delta-60 repeat protein
MFAIARYLPDGDLDPSFNGEGKVTTEFSEGRSTASGLVIDGEDRVILAGQVLTDDGLQFALTRHLPDGRLDSTFGGDGRVRIAFSEGRSFGTAVTIDNEKRIGAVDGGGGDEFAMVRLLADGQLDPSFGVLGRSRTAFDAGHGFALSVSVGVSDRIVAAGFVNAGVPGSVFALVRYLEDGSLDPAFGNDGRVLVQFQGADTAFGVVHDRRGRIVVAGKAGAGATSDAAVARLRPGGALDVTFGVNGRAYSDLGGSRGTARGIALTPENRIVLAGLAHHNLNQFGIAQRPACWQMGAPTRRSASMARSLRTSSRARSTRRAASAWTPKRASW